MVQNKEYHRQDHPCLSVLPMSFSFGFSSKVSALCVGGVPCISRYSWVYWIRRLKGLVVAFQLLSSAAAAVGEQWFSSMSLVV